MNRTIPLPAALAALALMLSATVFAYTLRPTQRVADQSPTFELQSMVPSHFGDWHEQSLGVAQIINPEQQAWIDKLYKQVLTRTYLNSSGQRIMLSIAYGGDQTESNEVHRPELCYPAQGFQVGKTESDVIQTQYGSIPVKRLLTTLGSRHEPVTYWVRVGSRVVRPGIDKKIEEIKYGLTGRIPDGLLFRVSSIDSNETVAFSVQDGFVREMLSSIEPSARLHLAGTIAKEAQLSK